MTSLRKEEVGSDAFLEVLVPMGPRPWLGPMGTRRLYRNSSFF